MHVINAYAWDFNADAREIASESRHTLAGDSNTDDLANQECMRLYFMSSATNEYFKARRI